MENMAKLKSMKVNGTKNYNHWIKDYQGTKGHPVIFDYLLFRMHMTNIKEMLLTLSFEKASFRNSKRRELTNGRSRDKIKTAGPGEMQYYENDNRCLSLSENGQ